MSIESVIRTKYIEEEERASAEAYESLRQPISVRIEVQHLNLLQALAERFDETRAGLGSQLLEAAIEEAFRALRPEDRRQVGVEADKHFAAYAEAHGISGFGGYWETLALVIEDHQAKQTEGGE